MANWKKVIVSGSNAELNQVTASSGIYIPTASLLDGEPTNYILTVDGGGSVERLDPKTIGSAFQSMSVSGHTGLGEFGVDTFIARPGLNELVFVSGSNVTLETSQSLNDASSETVGYIKINAITSSVAPVEHQTTVTHAGTVYTVGTVQDITTGSNVAFGTVSSSGDITGANLNIAGEIIHIGDTDTKIGFGTNEVNITTGATRRVHIDANGLEVTGDITASGTITASALLVKGDAEIGGNLGLGGNVFGLTGFGVVIDDIAAISGSTNFGSGSNPAQTNHRFTGSVSITGSDLILQDGIFTGDGTNLINLDADALFNVHNLSWGYGLTASAGSVYNPTSSITLNVHISGSEITSSVDGLYIPGHSLRVDQLATASNAGGIISWYSGSNHPYIIPIGTDGQVLTVHGDENAFTASFRDLPPTLALGIHTGSVTADKGNGVPLVLTSSAATNNIVAKIPISGSDNQITVSGSQGDNTIHLRLADNISGITSIDATEITASGLRVNGTITASGDLFVGGNFQVAGETTLLHTSNLLVEDAFLMLSSGSTTNDGGIIVQTGATSGSAFGFDTSHFRWVLQKGLGHNATSLSPDAFMVTTNISNEAPSQTSAPEYGRLGKGSGNIWVNTGSGDIWIYVD